MGSSLLHTAFEILFAFNLWYLDYDGSWYAPLWVHSPWNCVLLLDLYVYFIHQVRDVFNPFLLLLYQHYDTNVDTLNNVPEVPKLSSLKLFCYSDLFSTTMSSALLI